MLFDLQGSRKTAVKAIYLGLAILMAGGLILFGIGSTSGGLADIFNGGGGSSAKDTLNKDLKAYNKQPQNIKLLQTVMADRFNWIVDPKNYNPKKNTFSKEGTSQLNAMKQDWATYQKLAKGKIDVTTASYAVSMYLGLQDAKGAEKAQEIVTQKQPSAANFLALMQYALYAGDSLTGTGAEIKARELATKSEKAQVAAAITRVKKQVAQRSQAIQKQIQQQFAAQQQQGGGKAPGNPFGQ